MAQSDEPNGVEEKLFYPCPECGAKDWDSPWTTNDGTCNNCGHVMEDASFQKPFKEVVGVGGDDEDADPEIQSLCDAAEGPISPDDLTKNRGFLGKAGRGGSILSVLDDGEQPHYILHGESIDVEGGGDNTGIFGENRSRKFSWGLSSVTAVVTDQRILVIVPQMTGNDQRNIPYDSITGVDMDMGWINKRLTISTHGREYHISGFGTQKKVVKGAMDYIRKMQKQDPPRTEQETEEVEDPLEQIEKMAQLEESGVITEEEFESKKEELMDRV